MKKTIFITIIAISSLIVMSETGFFNALFMFFLLGIVPGTEIIIPANTMLLMISATACAVLFYPTARNVLRIILDNHATAQKTTIKTRLPKQRFSEI